MLALLVLLVSSLMAACDFGLQRSSFMGLHRLRPFGLATDCGSSDIWSSESMEPVRVGATRANGMHEFLFKFGWVAKMTEKGGVDTGCVLSARMHTTHMTHLLIELWGGGFWPALAWHRAHLDMGICVLLSLTHIRAGHANIFRARIARRLRTSRV